VGAPARDVVARHDHRAPAAEQRLRRRRHARRVRLVLEVERRRRQRCLVGLLLEHVDRQRHEHGAARRVLGDLEGPAQDRCQLVGALHLDAPLGDGRRHRHQVMAQHGLAQAQPRVLLPRGHDEGRARLERVVEHADRVAEPWRHVQVHHADAPAGLRVVAGRPQRHPLVERQHVADVGMILQAVDDGALRRAGIAEQALDALTDERLHEHLPGAHAHRRLSAPARA
jgi:hypothetical protein